MIRHATITPQGAQPRAMGAARLRLRRDRTGISAIADLRQSGALKLAFPRRRTDRLDAIVINTAGGITGGDRFTLAVEVETGAHLRLSTQAAERAYRAQPGEMAEVRARLRVESGARLDWLPQELILFDACALHRRLDISLGAGARLLMVEALVFGRAAMGERLGDIRLKDRIAIDREGRPLYRDGLDLGRDTRALLARPAAAAGAGAVASLVLVDPSAPAMLDRVRADLGKAGGASLLAPDTLVLRLVAGDSLDLRRTLLPILDRLTDHSLPATWRL